MQYRHVPILVIYFHLAIHVCLAYILYDTKRLFSSSINNFEKLRTFAGVSIAECEEECFKRKRCKGVLYNRRTLVCTLTSRRRRDQTIIENNGTVFTIGFNRIRKKDVDVCSTAKCAFTETCVLGDNGAHCETTECGLPPSIYTSYLGNMYSVNNSLMVLWESTYSKIICGRNGLWRGDNTQCLPGWSNFDTSCFFLDNSLRTYSEATAFCENLVPNAYLPTIKSMNKDTFVTDLLSSKETVGVWLGAQSEASDNVYYWRDGTAFGDGYTSWAQWEPNRLNETCVAVYRPKHYSWVDIHCDHQLNTLCEYVNPEP